MQHFNNLTSAEAERLHVLVGEMGEALAEVGKVTRHGYESRHPDGGPTNRENLLKELAHVSVAINRLLDAGDINNDQFVKAKYEKDMTAGVYLHHQQD